MEQVLIRDRHRNDLGDIDTLAQSILAVGLLHPIVVDERHRLVAGQRRLEAWRSLHGEKQPIPAHVVSTVDSARLLLMAERDENTCRKEMNPSESVALGLALEAIEKPKAKERQGTRTDQLPGNLPEGGEVRAIVAPAVGMSPRTYEKAKAVVAAANDPKMPEPVREAARLAQSEMDHTGKVDGAFRRVEVAKVDAFGDAVEQLTKGSPAVAKANWNHHATKLASSVAAFVNAPVDAFSQHVDVEHFQSVEFAATQLDEFVSRARKERSGLKAVK